MNKTALTLFYALNVIKGYLILLIENKQFVNDLLIVIKVIVSCLVSNLYLNIRKITRFQYITYKKALIIIHNGVLCVH